jgi:3-oxoacyl-[acyl-carrier protein] reductase
MYKGKTVLITGASRGVGLGLANHFIENGATVIGVSHDLEGFGEGIHWYPCDLSRSMQIKPLIETINKHHSVIDIVINNAAVLTSQYAIKMKVEDAGEMMFVDLLAPFLIAREAVHSMDTGGRIINISSMAVPLEPMGDSMYAACKAGLEKMSNIMAKEFQIFGVTVNTLGITAIETDMLKQLNQDKVNKVVAGLPLPRYAIMTDITNVIDFFCSPKSGYITAQTIYLGGVHN